MSDTITHRHLSMALRAANDRIRLLEGEKAALEHQLQQFDQMGWICYEENCIAQMRLEENEEDIDLMRSKARRQERERVQTEVTRLKGANTKLCDNLNAAQRKIEIRNEVSDELAEDYRGIEAEIKRLKHAADYRRCLHEGRIEDIDPILEAALNDSELTALLTEIDREVDEQSERVSWADQHGVEKGLMVSLPHEAQDLVRQEERERIIRRLERMAQDSPDVADVIEIVLDAIHELAKPEVPFDETPIGNLLADADAAESEDDDDRR